MWMAAMMLWPPSCDKWSWEMAQESLNDLESGKNEGAIMSMRIGVRTSNGDQRHLIQADSSALIAGGTATMV